jgi:hypothetical protein
MESPKREAPPSRYGRIVKFALGALVAMAVGAGLVFVIARL